jgi:hypothetical protein
VLWLTDLSATASTQAMRPFEWSTGRRNGPKPHGGCSGRPLVEWATSPSGAKIPLHLCYPLLIRLVERPLLDGQQEKFQGKAIPTAIRKTWRKAAHLLRVPPRAQPPGFQRELLERENFELRRANDPEEGGRVFRPGGARPPSEVTPHYFFDLLPGFLARRWRVEELRADVFLTCRASNSLTSRFPTFRRATTFTRF